MYYWDRLGSRSGREKSRFNMSTNKKPRKPYKPRPVRLTGSFYSQADITEIKSIINDMGLVVEVTLPRGEATQDHMVQIEDLLNWGGMMLFDRSWKGQEKEAAEFTNRQIKALYALAAIVDRKKSGKASRYIGTAEELDTIREVCSEIVLLLKEGMDTSPERTVKEFLAARQLAREKINEGVRDVFELPGRARAILNQRHFKRP